MKTKMYISNQIPVNRFCAVKLADLNYKKDSDRADDHGELFVAPIINLGLDNMVAVYATTNGDPIHLAQIEGEDIEWVESTDRDGGLSESMREVLSRAEWIHPKNGEGYSYLLSEKLAGHSDVERLANAFIVVLKSWLTVSEMNCVRELNDKETNPFICHTHDFCDANMAMAGAFEELMGRAQYCPADVEAGIATTEALLADTKLIDDAWSMAKQWIKEGPMKTMKWTDFYHGLSHLGELSDDRRATVRAFTDSCQVSYWTRGQGFNPPTVTFPSVKQARAAGERWISHGVQNNRPTCDCGAPASWHGPRDGHRVFCCDNCFTPANP